LASSIGQGLVVALSLVVIAKKMRNQSPSIELSRKEEGKGKKEGEERHRACIVGQKRKNLRRRALLRRAEQEKEKKKEKRKRMSQRGPARK